MTFFAVPDIKLFLSLEQNFIRDDVLIYEIFVINLFPTNQYLFLSALHGAIIMTIMMTVVMMTMVSAMMMMY